MASELKAQLTSEMKAAMKAKEKDRLAVIRSIQAAVKQIEIDSQKEIEDDADVIAIMDKMIKQRRDAHQQYVSADRKDLADQEAYEITVIQTFMPAALSQAEIEQMIDEAIAESGAAGMQDMGKIMAVLKPKMQGKADMGEVSQRVKAKLV